MPLIYSQKAKSRELRLLKKIVSLYYVVIHPVLWFLSRHTWLDRTICMINIFSLPCEFLNAYKMFDFCSYHFPYESLSTWRVRVSSYERIPLSSLSNTIIIGPLSISFWFYLLIYCILFSFPLSWAAILFYLMCLLLCYTFRSF